VLGVGAVVRVCLASCSLFFCSQCLANHGRLPGMGMSISMLPTAAWHGMMSPFGNIPQQCTEQCHPI
jgi:hypothetical protein